MFGIVGNPDGISRGIQVQPGATDGHQVEGPTGFPLPFPDLLDQKGDRGNQDEDRSPVAGHVLGHPDGSEGLARSAGHHQQATAGFGKTLHDVAMGRPLVIMQDLGAPGGDDDIRFL